jgi:pre-mRNA-splicing helicase BRR2
VDAGNSNILKVQIQEDLVYRPKTKDTRLVYEQLLGLVQRYIGDVSTADLKSAADEVIAILKTEELTDAERKREVEGIVDKLSDEAFNSLTVLA